MWNGHPQNKHRNFNLNIQKVQKTINKGGIVLGDVADNLIKIKCSKDMTASDNIVDNIVSRINKIKGKRQALRSNWLRTQNTCRDSPKTHRTDN